MFCTWGLPVHIFLQYIVRNKMKRQAEWPNSESETKILTEGLTWQCYNEFCTNQIFEVMHFYIFLRKKLNLIVFRQFRMLNFGTSSKFTIKCFLSVNYKIYVNYSKCETKFYNVFCWQILSKWLMVNIYRRI